MPLQARPPDSTAGNGIRVPHARGYESLSDLPCAGHPACHYLVDDDHVTGTALDAIRVYMDAAHAENLAGRGTRGPGD
jgi:hypothetical protein